jgi:hypothetical protein
MKIVSNEKMIKRNNRIGTYLTFGSLAILGLGLYFSFANTQYFQLSLIALLVGFIMSQIGIYMGNRYGRKPRPDQSISAALKGLEDKYTLYHYMTPVSHLLVGPAGIWILLPYFQTGIISYDEKKKRWRQKGGNLYLKLFGQENLGRPDLDISPPSTDMKKFLAKTLPGTTPPDIQVALVFTNEKTKVDAENAPIPTLHIDKLKDFIRRQAKKSQATLETINTIQSTLPSESIMP